MDKPTIEEIEAYINEKCYNVNAEQFFSYYESNGWKVGKNNMKNWKRAVVTWECKDKPKIKLGTKRAGKNDLQRIGWA